jgi:apoptosis-inducing factor 2
MATHSIVVIGASFAGLGAAQHLLKDVIPQVSNGGNNAYKVVQIAPNDEFFWKIGAPRVIGNPKSLPLEKALIPIAPGFKQYSKEQYEFIKAYVTSIEPASRTVHTSTSQSIHYDSLIISSGTKFTSQDNIWSVADGVEPLKEAIHKLHEKIPAAQSILIAGGGPAGIETAGELGEIYGGQKEITILSGTTSLLPRISNKAAGRDAQSRLEKMGLKVINDNVRVTEETTEGGKYVLKLSNGESKTVDVYINATGDKPNASFVPPEWLNENGQIKTNPNTLRLDVPGAEGIYVYGSVGSYSNGSIFDIKFAQGALLETIKLDLQGKGMSATPSRKVHTNNNCRRPSHQQDLQEDPVRYANCSGRLERWHRHCFRLQAA